MCPPLDSSSQPGSPLRYYGASVYFLLKETVSRNWINTWKLLLFHFLQLILLFSLSANFSVIFFRTVLTSWSLMPDLDSPLIHIAHFINCFKAIV
jgi:hypothetical protein